MAVVAYFRVSTLDQSIESQRHALISELAGGSFEEEFTDEGVSGATAACERPGFSKLLAFLRRGDRLYIYSVDRLGRDAIDVQTTVRSLLDKGVTIHVHGLGQIARGVGELILAVLAQVADMERRRINERTAAGRATAKEALAKTGKTHKGKLSLGRPRGRVAVGQIDPHKVVQWRSETDSSFAQTAKHWQVSVSTVKRYCRSQGGI